MKAIILIITIASLFALASARAATTTPDPKPLPCDASWDACAVGRTDWQHPGRFIVDILYLSQDEIKANTPLFGSDADGDESGKTPFIQSVVEIDSTDVLIQTLSNTGAPALSFSVGKILQPIGNDTNQYYTRQVVLNPGVKIQSTTKTSTNNYCDPGTVWGAFHYIQHFTTTDSVITGATPDPFNFEETRMKIPFSYPAVFGCK